MEASVKFKMVEKIITSQDETLLEEVKSLLGLSENDFWDELSNSTKESIQRGLEQSQRGETIPHEKVMSEIKSPLWRQRPAGALKNITIYLNL